MRRRAAKRGFGAHLIGDHPLEMYDTTKPPNSTRGNGGGRGARTPRPTADSPRRPQLNALLDSWDDVAKFRAVAHVRRVHLSDVLTPALDLFVKTLPPAERRAIALEAKRIRATFATE
jgi:hypothetical protein